MQASQTTRIFIFFMCNTIVTSAASNVCAQYARRRECWLRTGRKKKQLVNTAVGLHAAATRLIHLNSRVRACARVCGCVCVRWGGVVGVGQEGGEMVELTPTRRIQKLWLRMFLNVKESRRFFMRVVSCVFLSNRCSTTEPRPPRPRTPPAPQSQVFVFISTGINTLSGQRSRPSAITGPQVGSSTS